MKHPRLRLADMTVKAEDCYDPRDYVLVHKNYLARLQDCMKLAEQAMVPTPPDQLEVLEAAIGWAYCPSDGSYSGEPHWSMEDTCERLSMAVRAMTGKDIESPPYPNHWSYEEMRKAITSAPDSTSSVSVTK